MHAPRRILLQSSLAAALGSYISSPFPTCLTPEYRWRRCRVRSCSECCYASSRLHQNKAMEPGCTSAFHSLYTHTILAQQLLSFLLLFSALTLLVRHQEEHPAACNVCSEVQMIRIWSSWCHCHPIISCFIKIQIGLTFLVPAYQGCPGKEAIKRVPIIITITLSFTYLSLILSTIYQHI